MGRTASIVTVGTELVLGLRVDTNTQEIARALARRGYDVVEAISVADDPSVVSAAIRRLAARDALVIVTGGLGPTHDDVTRAAAADALGLALARDPDLERRLQPVVARHKAPHAAAQVLGQADVLAGARVLLPTVGTAPGQLLSAPSGARVVLLPGPPAEMRPMLDEVLDLLDDGSQSRVTPRELGCVGITESDAQVVAERVLERYSGIRLTLLAKPADVRVVLIDEGGGVEALDAAASQIASALGASCYSTDGSTLAESVLRLARERALTIATAESCTGGLVAAALTDVSGSSQSFLGGLVAYADETKSRLLGVSPETIARHGAVSAQCAVEMATGARQYFSADLAVSTTGIAGPSGGSADKPVGLVWFAVATDLGVTSTSRTLPGDRAGVRVRATAYALDLIRRAALEL